MRTKLFRGFLVMIMMGVTNIYAQIINTNTSTQECQGDTITVTFSVNQLLNIGNTFRVELSDPGTGAFTGNFIEMQPLMGVNVGGYAMDAIIPATTPQGLYAIRVVSTDPISIGDTVPNIIVGRKPTTNVAIFGTFLVNNIHRFCDGDDVFLVGPPPPPGESHNYLWFENGLPIPGSNNDTLVVTETGIYRVEVTLGLCKSNGANIVVNKLTIPTNVAAVPGPDVIVIAPDSIRVCAGTAASFNGPPATGGLTFSYQWLADSVGILGQQVNYPLVADTFRTFSTTQPGRYRMFIQETIGGCSDTSDYVYVFVDSVSNAQLLNIPFPGQPTSSLNLCPEDSVLLSLSVTDPSWVYEWQISFPLGTPFVTVPFTGTSVVIDTAVVFDSLSVRVIVRNGACVDTTNALNINFIQKPIVNILQGDSIGVCQGDSVLLVAQGTANTYSWNNGTFLSNAIYVRTPGTYIVRGVGVNQCTAFDTIVVFSYVTTANAGPDQTVTPGTTVELNGSGGTGFYWFASSPVTFSNPQSATTFTDPTADTTTYYLMVMDGNGCFAIDSMRVFIVDDNPNARFSNVMNLITPNGDGMNDVWDISEVIENDVCELLILNRWGTEVFYTTSYRNNWGGTNTGGDNLPDGTYFYILQCDDEIRLKGAVTILRNE